MRVLIDAHMVGERETGNETYVTSLLGAWARLDHDDEIIVAAAHPEDLPGEIGSDPRFAIVPVSVSPVPRLMRELPALVRSLRADVLHVTYAGPPWPGCPIAVVVHDVSYRVHPEWFSPRDRVVLSVGVGLTIRRARIVLTVSETSRREILRCYPVAAGRVKAIHNSAGEGWSAGSREADTEVLGSLGIDRPFLLAVGNLQPRKNLIELVRAFADARPSFRVPHRLALVGKAQWRESDVLRTVRASGLSEEVIFTGYVERSDLPALYRQATGLAYPSLYEGFGLPIVEAMRCGTPVMTSDRSSMAEIAGGAAILVDPRSREAIRAGLVRLVNDSDNCARLSELGRVRAASFSWERCGRMTLEALREAAGSG